MNGTNVQIMYLKGYEDRGNGFQIAHYMPGPLCENLSEACDVIEKTWPTYTMDMEVGGYSIKVNGNEVAIIKV